MDEKARRGRYTRIRAQLEELLTKTPDPVARMATVVALLHHKMPHFFWTGFYRLLDGDLVVGPYQGPLACQVLARGKGVCWAGVQRGESVVVPDVEKFPGHIACDARSKSEIVVPLRDAAGQVVGVLDVDSDRLAAFDAVDREGLEPIVAMISQEAGAAPPTRKRRTPAH
ncbi:MAG: GAF domain-containing protein [Acidobacteria bacterium]|nr:GAF domain-containing protein [Acidobacteriota bacterium]